VVLISIRFVYFLLWWGEFFFLIVVMPWAFLHYYTLYIHCYGVAYCWVGLLASGQRDGWDGMGWDGMDGRKLACG